MENQLLFTKSSSVYPGEYVPPFKEKDLDNTVKYSSKNKSESIPVNIEESGNSYKIEFAIPGVKRENLFLKADGNILSISVLHSARKSGKQNSQLHGFNFDHGSTHNLVLPDNADPIFVSAKFKAGTLYVCIPKSSHPLKSISTKIAIY